MLTKLLDVLSIEVTRLKYTYVTTRRGPAFREHEIVFLRMGGSPSWIFSTSAHECDQIKITIDHSKRGRGARLRAWWLIGEIVAEYALIPEPGVVKSS